MSCVLGSLRGRRTFATLRQEGQVLKCPFFKVNFRILHDEKNPKTSTIHRVNCAFIVSKRFASKAVARNKKRRVLKEALRTELLAASLPLCSVDMVVIPFHPKRQTQVAGTLKHPSFQTLCQDFKKALLSMHHACRRSGTQQP